MARRLQRIRHAAIAVAFGCCAVRSAAAQTTGQRGFAEASSFFYPQDTPIDRQNLVGDLLVRDEGYFKPFDWLQLTAGADARANTHEQVESSWRVDFRDRGTLRPRLSIRRLNATIARGPLTIDLGKQFIRWGKTDIVTPTDRFAPRDFLNVVDNDFLAVTGLRVAVQHGANGIDAVWVPWMTPSRIPLLNQRWSAVTGRPPVPLVDGGAEIPGGSEAGIRVSRTGAGYDVAFSFFDGFNYLPNIDAVPTFAAPGIPASVTIIREYPQLRSYGADASVPTRWVTLKGEAAYFTSSSAATDEYVLYVAQLEKQKGEWLLVGGYAGEAVTASRGALTFAPDRGLAKSIVARASYTIDPNRDATIETAVRQNGRGALVKGSYSQAHGSHWRTTVAAALIRGRADDFLGQYRLNSHATLALRYSF